MRKFKTFILLFLFIFLCSCGGNHKRADENQTKKNLSVITEMKQYFEFERDSFQQGEFYKVYPKGVDINKKNNIYAYFTINNGKACMIRLIINSDRTRLPDGWAMATFYVDGKVETLTPQDRMVRENDDHVSYKYPSAYAFLLLDLLNNKTKEVKIKLHDLEYYKTRTVSREEIDRLKLVAKYFRALDGDLEDLP